MEGEWPISNDLSVELSTSSATLGSLPFVDDTDHTEATILEAGQRNCWTMPQLGRWGFVLMGAELGGGRETAMLTGGAAGIPAWWMAFISLSLSAVSLLLLYPLMYKVYHQDTDDMLSNKHIEHVVKTTVSKVAARLHITIDWEVYKAESRELSIDIMVPTAPRKTRSPTTRTCVPKSFGNCSKNSRSSACSSRSNSRCAR